jgi:hypothetical protein
VHALEDQSKQLGDLALWADWNSAMPMRFVLATFIF